MIVINAQAAANVEIADVKALGPDLLHKADHDVCCIAEDGHLQECRPCAHSALPACSNAVTAPSPVQVGRATPASRM